MKTKSEQIFETFLEANNVRFEKIKEDRTPRPDYLVSVREGQLIFELKELAEGDNFGVAEDPNRPFIKSHSRKIGEHVRRRIEGAKKQIQYGANRGIPSVLLIYNNLDPVIQAFGTEDMDFTAAMYGEYTILIDKSTGQSSEMFNGKTQSLQERKNTSFSALGRLCDRGGKTTLTLFENVFAKVALPYEQLPRCFDVRRAEISTEPLSFTANVHTVSSAGPAYQAFQLLRIAFVIAPILAGIDKFFHFLVDWDKYLAPIAANLSPISGHSLMLIIGVIEIIAGLIVAFKPKVGAWIVAIWLWLIIINLLLIPGYFDIALRDFGLSLGAVALARLSVEFAR